MIFYLGIEEASWLTRVRVPTFLSRHQLAELREKMPVAPAPWALDSGGFTEVTFKGGWSLSAKDYAREVRFYQREIGNLEFAAPLDWMCESDALKATGKSVREHQALTLRNYLELLDATGDPWLFLPVLQGETVADYLRHVEDYARAGLDLAVATQRLRATGRRRAAAGVGSICRRQASGEAAAIIKAIAACGIDLHAFGLSKRGVQQVCAWVVSSDSQAWSKEMRNPWKYRGAADKVARAPRAPRGDRLAYALNWREELLAGMAPACREDHPRLGTLALAAYLHAAAQRARRPARKVGTRTTRELQRLLEEVGRVVHTNVLLEAEEEVEEDRGYTVAAHGYPVPATYRATLPPDVRAQVLALTPNELERITPAWHAAIYSALTTESGGAWPPR